MPEAMSKRRIKVEYLTGQIIGVNGGNTAS